MSFEERIERITERHEALAQSVELFLMTTRENAARTDAHFDRLTERMDHLTVRMDQLTVNVDHLTVKIDDLTDDVKQLSGIAGALVRTAESHERRITRIEGGRA